MIVYKTVYCNLMDYVCMLLCFSQIYFQLVTALIVVLPLYVHTFTCDVLSQYNSDYFICWACFLYAIISFGFGVQFLISG